MIQKSADFNFTILQGKIQHFSARKLLRIKQFYPAFLCQTVAIRDDSLIINRNTDCIHRKWNIRCYYQQAGIIPNSDKEKNEHIYYTTDSDKRTDRK